MSSKNLIVGMIVVVSSLWASASFADHRDGYYRDRGYDNYYDHRDHRDYYRYRGYRRHGDNDDVAWAVGGFILGTIVSEASRPRQAQVVQPLPPPQRRKVVTCYDEVAYDSDNKPYVARQCYETMQ